MKDLLVPLKWREVIWFVILAYLFSWLWWGALMFSGVQSFSNLSQMSAEDAQAAQIMVAIGDFGPLLAALIMRLFISREGLRGSMGWRRSWKYYLFALLARPNWSWAASLTRTFKYHWAWIGTMALGVTLALWLVVEGVLIGFLWPIQYVTAVNGLLILLLALWPTVRKFYAK